LVSSTTFDYRYGHAANPESEQATLRRLEGLAKLLDSAFAIPVIGTRVGADALLNFIPGAGLVMSKGVSAYLVWEAYRLGVPRGVIARMAGNVAADLAISVVPVAGWVADVFFRANLRNMRLLREHLEPRHPDFGKARQRRSHPVTIDGEVIRDAPR
jgi:ABC-type antimicrobial peptide transport system permease subunit